MNRNKTAIENLFPDNATVSSMQLVDYLDWACCPINYEKILALPPIQRGSVWKPKQIADLWDSLLRKMPVGSFMLSRLGEDDARTSIQAISERPMETKGKVGFNLLDGQQRTLALLLAWPGVSGADKMIWVDFGEDGANGSPFMLRVTTQSQPFGFQPIWHNKLSLSDRLKAREQFLKKENIDGKKNPNYKLPLDKTLPWKADQTQQKWLVPLRDLWKMLQEADRDVEKWCQFVKSKYFQDFDSEDTVNMRLFDFGHALIYLEKSSVALILVPELKRPEVLNDPSHDPMTVLFERIATGGTRLSPDDLLFSMIKQIYPEAHNLVQEIHALKGANGLPLIGHMMKQTDLVMTAVRLACADPNAPDHIQKLKDNSNPNARDFYNYLEGGSILGSDAEPGPLLRLIKKTENTEAPLVLAFRQLATVLEHRKGDDMGLPRVLLPYLNQPLLQVLLFWLVRQPQHELNIENSREDILRFVLYWILCERDADSSRKASLIAFAYLKTTVSNCNFPAGDLYEKLCEEDDKGQFHLLMLVHPTTLKNVLNLTLSPQLRTKEERFKKPITPEESQETRLRALYDHFWHRNIALLWIQRAMLTSEYSDYDALADKNDKDNVPYDFDHLCPQAHWSDGRSIKAPTLDPSQAPDVHNAFWSWKRHLLGNAIGNYRIVDASENRSDSDNPLSEKFNLNVEVNQPNKKWIDSAFFPADEELACWRKASPVFSEPEKHLSWYWDTLRIESFQYAVESRTFRLYQRYFNEAGFKDWFS